MSDIIAINLDDAEALTQEFAALAGELTTLMGGLEASVATAGAHWQGQSLMRFLDLFDQLRPEMRKFEAICETYHKSLQTVTEQFASLDAQFAAWFA